MTQNDSEDGFFLALGLLAIATAPVWLPALAGIKPKYCECGAKIEPSGITPGCKCYY
jgi:hypothetical protein